MTPRVGFTVGKVLGGSVERNRIKRRMREAVRLSAQACEGPIDVVFNPRKSVSNLALRGIGKRSDARPAAGRTTRPDRGTKMKQAMQFVLRCYQRVISPMLPHSCRFVPTCSQYAIEAVECHGAVRGSLLAAARLLRCHPFARAGFDPVPPAMREIRARIPRRFAGKFSLL